jgi:hypothetical protein
MSNGVVLMGYLLIVYQFTFEFLCHSLLGDTCDDHTLVRESLLRFPDYWNSPL